MAKGKTTSTTRPPTGDTISCPKCGTKIPLTDALRAAVEESIRKEFDAKLAFEIEGTRKKLEDGRKRELDLLKKNEELEEKTQTVELEIARRIHEERTNIENAVADKLAEQHRLGDAVKEQQLAGLRKQIEDLKRSADQRSQQLQGEAAEINVEAFLRSTCPDDEITPVPAGMRGADFVQLVVDRGGRACGSIVWEVKNTKNWSDGWLAKLRDDQRELKADVAVIVTDALPRGVKHFGLVGRVWVTDYAALGGVLVALRLQLVQIASVRAASAGRATKMGLLYDYLTGKEFAQRVEAMLEGVLALRDDLERERRSMSTIWARRDKQIDRALSGLAGMYGDMQGMVGAGLPKVARLELPAGGDSDSANADPEALA